jgi:hypothetical protein
MPLITEELRIMNATSRLEGLSTLGFSAVSGNDMNQIEGGDVPVVVTQGAVIKEGLHVVRTIVDAIDDVVRRFF